MSAEPGATYESAGVSIEAGERAVQLMKAWVDKARRPEMLGGLGGFAGLFDAGALKSYAHPVLATSADGVGTKVVIAAQMDKHDTIGFDLVGMLVDDLVVCGAEPLFLTDYIATGRVVPERIAAIVKGVAQACVVAGCALIGGETAEHPGLLEPDEYDLAGSTTGVVEAADLLGPGLVEPGDAIVAMRSSGLHSNGYSLVRHVLLGPRGWALDRYVPELERTLGEELLEPTRIYTKPCLALARATRTHAMAHVTGGGLAANLARVLPDRVAGRIDRSTWSPQPVFGLVGERGRVERSALESTLNMGVGMVAVLHPDDADAGVRLLGEHGVVAWICGEASATDGEDAGTVRMEGDYA
jgi:phosphoribosylformylglycinamidine cyclo-ligase